MLILESSPRVWGQVETVLNDSWDKRIIPTRVGTSYLFTCLILLPKDHPHAYGDKTPYIVFAFQVLGSSPRVWGQGFPCILQAVTLRIIPTRMGTRTSAVTPSSKILGSSPRVWGQGADYQCLTLQGRIIPTRMGTSFRCMEHI